MGIYNIVSPARSKQQSSSSNNRGRASPSAHVIRQNRPGSAQSQPFFPMSTYCGVIGSGSGNNGAFVSPSPPRRQQRPYAASPSPQARPFVPRAAPQDRHSSQFRPIPQSGSGMRSPVQQHSPTQSIGNSRRSSASPAENSKYKMELCNNYMKGKTCPFGDNCHFAHGAAELNRRDPIEMVKNGRLLYICEIWAMTGACPFGTRCKYLHDPNVVGPTPAWLPLNTKPAKNDPLIVPDANFHHRMNFLTQVNPVVGPHAWEKCRPDREFNHGDEFKDTVDMVCNNNVTVFPPSAIARATTTTATCSSSSTTMSYSSIVRNTNPTSEEATTLAIVLAMVNTNVFTYTPTHCLNDQPCQILQSRYFRYVGGPFVVQEVSTVEYCQQGSYNSIVIRADEVVFDSKGKPSCNQSIWFDTHFTPFSGNKAKKIAKKISKNDKNVWPNNTGESSLFCLPNNEEFTRRLPVTPPFMIMQSNSPDGFDIMKRILQYRIDDLVGLNSTDNFSQFKRASIEYDFSRLAGDLRRWKQPRTENLDHLKTNEVNTPYTPSDPQCHAARVYNSFAANLNPDKVPTNGSGHHLRVFQQITSKAEDDNDVLPLIMGHNDLPTVTTPSVATETWQDLLLEGIDGKWSRAFEEKKIPPPSVSSPSSMA